MGKIVMNVQHALKSYQKLLVKIQRIKRYVQLPLLGNGVLEKRIFGIILKKIL